MDFALPYQSIHIQIKEWKINNKSHYPLISVKERG